MAGRLLAQGPELVVVTLGADGSYFQTASGRRSSLLSRLRLWTASVVAMPSSQAYSPN